jgi:hemerythrin
MTNQKLVCEDTYTVGVKLIDDQHKKMFDTINQLIEVLGGVPTKSQIDEIVNNLVEYKKFHFTTE